MGTVRLRFAGPPTRIVYSPDGKMLAAAGIMENGTAVRLCEAATGRELRRLGGGQDQYLDIAFSPRGDVLAARPADGHRVDLWDAGTGKLLRRLETGRDPVLAFAFSPDGKLLAAAGGDYNESRPSPIYLWEPASGRRLKPLAGHVSPVVALAFSADGRRLVSRSVPLRVSQGAFERTVPGAVCVWDVAGGQKVSQAPSGDVPVALAPDGSAFALWGADGLARVTDVATQRDRAQIRGAQGPFFFSPDGKLLIGGGRGQVVRFWHAATGREVRTVQARSPHDVEARAVSPDGKRLAAAGADGVVRVWDLASGLVILPQEGHQAEVACVAVHPGGQVVASGGPGDGVRLWDAATGKKLRVLEGNQGGARSLAYSPDGTLLAASGFDGTVVVWEAATGRQLQRLKSAKGGDLALTFSRDGRGGVTPPLLLGAGLDGLLRAWDVTRGQEVRQVRCGHEGVPMPLSLAALSPGGKLLAYLPGPPPGGGVGRLVTASGKDLPALDARPDAAAVGYQVTWRAVAFSPDGRLLATSDRRDTPDASGQVPGPAVQVWEVATGQPVLKLAGVDVPGNLLRFTPDSQALAYVTGLGPASGPGAEQTIHFRDVTSGSQSQPPGLVLRPAQGHFREVTCLAFAPGGGRGGVTPSLLVTGSADGTLIVWDVEGFRQRPQKAAHLSAAELDATWSTLAGNDATAAYRAMARLTAAPEQAVPWVRQRLQPAPEVEPGRLGRLITELQSKRYVMRSKAIADLEELDELAEPALRKLLANRPTLELSRRLELMLGRLDKAVLTPDHLRQVRCVAVLERIGTPAARLLLERLGGGNQGARLTWEAREAMQRLARQQASAPAR
jgi:WD40 repeat protein